ncbi:MAG: hypothetical protein GWO02_15210, partial [Gammaproteobacteria bacterium]|nr:hypothetical protein [Gammaproteobacteria bacterium]
PEIQNYVHLREPVYTEADLARARSAVLWWSRHMNVFIRRDLVTEGPAAGPP